MGGRNRAKPQDVGPSKGRIPHGEEEGSCYGSPGLYQVTDYKIKGQPWERATRNDDGNKT